LQPQEAWFDRDQALIRNFRTGVSIHSHTSRSKEGLDFLEPIFESHSLLRAFIRAQEKAADKGGVKLDFARGYWNPPLCPRSAYEVEKNQIEQTLGMQALVSLTDHDCIDAPLLLRIARHETPVSLEWTVPFQTSKFHLGVHNLPGARAQELVDELKACTAQPSTERVCDLLRALHAIPEVLVVFNHPLWNLYANPALEFARNMEDFLALNNGNLHALELNGLRRREENRQVAELAARWQQIVVSGGDRHGCEANANLNLTNASSFDEWVQELRRERRSHILYMPHYRDSRVTRFYQTFLDAVAYYPDHSDGASRWEQRTFHPGRDGSVQPVGSLWTRGVPRFLETILNLARLPESTHLLSKFRSSAGPLASSTSEISIQEEGA
jgi:hypothetical protein